MKKFALGLLLTGFVLMTGCAGDDPAGPDDGTLPTVTGLTIITADTHGRTVALSWDAVTGVEVDGYRVFHKEDNTGDWVKVDEVVGTTYNHEADAAGTYVVKAYQGENTSEANSNEVSTMPNIITTSYTIWNNLAPAHEHSGFIFGATAGQTGLAGSTAFAQDIYCYDGDYPESPVGFYSGDRPPFGNGNHTQMSAAANNEFGHPTGAWWTDGFIRAGDVIFAELHDGFFVKIYVTAIPVHPDNPNAHGVTFYYDYQPIVGLHLFTTVSTP